MLCRAWSASASRAMRAWATFWAAALRALSRAASRSLVHCLILEDLRTGLAQFVSVLIRAGFGALNGPVRVFHGACGAGAALVQSRSQRSLDQNLVHDHQQGEQHHGRHGAQQEPFDLLNDLLHS
jgi:hypothetical protein